MQKPTVGRQVHYWPAHWEYAGPENACAATVIAVTTSTSVTDPRTGLALKVILPDGSDHTEHLIFHSPTPKPGYWTWPAIDRSEVDPALYTAPER